VSPGLSSQSNFSWIASMATSKLMVACLWYVLLGAVH
jgi:hypothetical protein